MKIRLHTRYQNSAGQRVRIVLNLKGIDYEYVAIPSLGSDDYKALNPQGLMPTLEIDGQVVSQSMAMLELLEELYPEPPILPADPVDRARVRAFAQIIAADLHPVNNGRVRDYLAEVGGAGDDQVMAWVHHWMAEAFSALETQLARRAVPDLYCFGDQPGMADACLVPQMDNARRFGFDLKPYPRLVAVDAACRRLDAFKNAAAEAQPDFPGLEAAG